MIQLQLTTGQETRHYPVPEGWHELSARQFCQAVALVSQYEEEAQLLAHALRLVFPESCFEKTCVLDALADQVLPLLAWIAEPPEELPQLLPAFRLGRVAFRGPAADFADLTLAEFHFAEVALHHLLAAPDDLPNLFRFVAILYHRVRLNPRTMKMQREPLDADNLSRWTALFRKKLSVEKARAIVFWYRHTRRMVAEMYPRIFAAGQAGEDGEQQAPNYFPLMRALAREGTYGTFAAVEQMLLLNAFQDMEAALDEKEAREAAAGKTQE